MNPAGGHHKSNETRDWEKPARIHQGQIDKPDAFCDTVNCLVDVGQVVDFICLDFSKAFGMVSCSLLLEKLMRCSLDKWSVRWVGNWLRGCTQRTVVDSSFSNGQPVTSGVPQGSMLGPGLFNIFLSDLDDGTECTLMKFADDTRQSGEVDTSERRATLQDDLDRLEEWGNKSLMKFSKDKCKVLHLGKHNPGVQHRLGSTWLGSSSVERDLGVRMDSKLSVSEQCAAAEKKASRMWGCINKGITSRDKEVTIPLRTCQVTPAILCSVLVPAMQNRCGQAGEGPEKGHKADQRTAKLAV